MASLFGPTPAEIMMARQKEQQQMNMLRQQQISQEGGQFGAFAPLYQAGLRFGDVGAQAMRQRMFPEQVDPQLQKATAIQGVLAKYQGQDLNSAEVMTSIAKELSMIDPEAGLRAGEIARKLQKEGGKISLSVADLERIDPEQRAQVIADYQATGKLPSDVVIQSKDGIVKTTPEIGKAAKALGFKVKPNLDDYTNKEMIAIEAKILEQKKDIARAGVQPLEDVYGKGVTVAAVKKDEAIFDSAQKAISELAKIDQTLDLIESGQIVTGFGADLRLNVERFIGQFAGDPAAKAKVTNTQVLEALLGSDVFPLIGALGIGARGLDTIPERQFLQKVFTGEISLDQATLLRLTEIRRNVTQRVIERYNERVEKGQLDRFFKYSGEEKTKINIPRRSPAGIREMSDQELLRLRQQGGATK
jgi:hypothetical protein